MSHIEKEQGWPEGDSTFPSQLERCYAPLLITVGKQQLRNVYLHSIHGGLAFNSQQNVPSPVDPLHLHQVAALWIHLYSRVLRLNDEFLGFHDSGSLHTHGTKLFQVGFIEGLFLFLGCSEQARYFSSAYL